MSTSADAVARLFDRLHGDLEGPLAADRPDAERIECVLRAVRESEPVIAKNVEGYRDYGGGIEIAEVHQSPEIVGMVVRLGPGATLEPHDHVGFVGGMTVIDGALTCADYAFVQGERPQGDARVQLAAGGVRRFETGEQSMILSDSGQIHRIEAGPEGAAFFDVYLMHQTPGSCLFMDVDDHLRARAAAEVSLE